MVLLDKLIEKKDLMLYTKLRIELLQKELKKIPKKTEPKKRQMALKQVRGRIMELKRMRAILNKIKDQSKTIWKNLAEEK